MRSHSNRSAACVVCGRTVRLSSPPAGHAPWYKPHRDRDRGGTCVGSYMSILPPPKLPDSARVVVQEEPLAVLTIGIFAGDVLVGIEQLVDERASWCRYYNRTAQDMRTGLTARPITVETIGGDA